MTADAQRGLLILAALFALFAITIASADDYSTGSSQLALLIAIILAVVAANTED